MKKTFTLFLMMLLCGMTFAQVSTWDGTWEAWTNGTGTEDDPFLIENAQQLAYLTFRVNNGLDAGGGHVSNPDYHYKLMTNIDLNGSEDFQWTPIGYYYSDTDYQCFGGLFDGNNHTVSGLYINSFYDRVGLFGFTDGTTIKGLTVLGIKVVTSGGNTGGIIGVANNSTVIENCGTVFSDLISSSIHAGGIIGFTDGTTLITNCYHIGDVSITNSENASSAGGILGYANGSVTFTDCHALGNIETSSSSSAFTGGLVGYITDESIITNCYSEGGNLSATTSNYSGYLYSYCGGIVGFVGNATITYCYNTNTTNSSATMTINHFDSYSNTGGIVGKAGSLILNNCYNSGNVLTSGSLGYYRISNAGGLVGIADNTEITNCYNIGSVTARYDYINAGGIIGQKSNGTVLNSYYLNTCGGQNTAGGSPLSSDAMQTTEFVTILNNGSLSYKQDVEPYLNNGYPIFTGFILETLPATEVDYTTATLNGSYTPGIFEITELGFEYKKVNDEEFTRITNTDESPAYYSCAIDNLAHDSTYHYRAFATAAQGTAYGDLVEFTMLTPPIFTISASTDGNGTINPNGEIVVHEGDDCTFNFNPYDYFTVKEVLVDGVSVGSPSSYTFENVTSDHTISVSFRSLNHLITAEASGHGSIEPEGEVWVPEGENITFNFHPNDGFDVGEILVDGESVELASSYTFSNVIEDHSIKVTFVEMTGPCLPPLNLIVSEIGATSVRLSWQGGADIYVIIYGVDDSYNHAASTSDNTMVLTGLTQHSNYKWKIKSVCGELETRFVDGQPFFTSGHGVDENNSVAFSLWPNPTNETLNIASDNLKRVELYDVLGQLVIVKESQDVTTSVDVSNLKAGLYLVRVTDTKGNVGIEKAMITPR